MTVETDFASGSKIVYQSGSQTYLSNNFKHAFTKVVVESNSGFDSIFIGSYGFQKSDQAHII